MVDGEWSLKKYVKRSWDIGNYLDTWKNQEGSGHQKRAKIKKHAGTDIGFTSFKRSR